MNIKRVTYEEVSQLIEKEDTEVIMSVIKETQDGSGRIVRSYIVVPIEKGNNDWHDTCKREYQSLYKCDYLPTDFCIEVY